MYGTQSYSVDRAFWIEYALIMTMLVWCVHAALFWNSSILTKSTKYWVILFALDQWRCPQSIQYQFIRWL